MKKELPTREEFEAYVKVQRSGRYNMFSPQAYRATGLRDRVYTAIMENYEKLMKKYPDVVK